MSGVEITIRLAVVAVLASYLFIKHRQRMRNRSEQCDPAKWTGQAIDVAQIKPRVEDVRRNYLAPRQPAKGLCFHRALLDLARRAVARLGYFQERESQHHAETHRP